MALSAALLFGSYLLMLLNSSESFSAGPAAWKARRPENAEGSLFVDESCIDCDTCRWMDERTYAREGGKSAVVRQPVTDEEKIKAYIGMVSCPTGSIRLEDKDALAKEAMRHIPWLVDEKSLPGVFYMGFHSKDSFGGTPYLAIAPEASGGIGTAVMVDSPRFNTRLKKRVQELCLELTGKAHPDFMFLTHRDDVADHQKWHDAFEGGMRRCLHQADVTGGTELVEVKYSGAGPWALDGTPVQDDADAVDPFVVHHTPGHTAGCVSLLLRKGGGRGEGCLFTGDHLAFNHRLGRLDGFARYNRQSVGVQADSMRKLAGLDFDLLLPAHGRKWRSSDPVDSDSSGSEGSRSKKKEKEILHAADVFESSAALAF